MKTVFLCNDLECPDKRYPKGVKAWPAAARLAWRCLKAFLGWCAEQADYAPLVTNEAAPAINRKPQTLRDWHHRGVYAIPELRPTRINGRLAWPVAGLRKLMGVQ